MAVQSIDTLAMEWEPESFHDSFREEVEALVKAKAAGETVGKAEPAAEPTSAIDLMEALRAGVERARSPKGTGARAASPGARAALGQKTPTPKKRARSGPGAKGRELMALTKAELYEKAAAADIPGRASTGSASRAPSRATRARHSSVYWATRRTPAGPSATCCGADIARNRHGVIIELCTIITETRQPSWTPAAHGDTARRSPSGRSTQGDVQQRLGGPPGIRERLRFVARGCQRIGAFEDHGQLSAEGLRVGGSGFCGGVHEAITKSLLVSLREAGDLREFSRPLDDGVVERASADQGRRIPLNRGEDSQQPLGRGQVFTFQLRFGSDRLL